LQIDTVLQGLSISCVGMGLVFLALGLLVGAIVLMGRTLRPRSQAKVAPGSIEADRAERAQIAAIAVAIALAQEDAGPVPAGAWESVGWDDPSPRQTALRWRAAGR